MMYSLISVIYMKMVSGIDEAGRGSILGPLVIAGASFEEKDLCRLHGMEVKDSKLLSKQKRSIIFEKITRLAASYMIIKIDCSEIDEHVFLKKLNDLESKYMAKIIDNIKSDSVCIDSCDPNAFRFGNKVLSQTQRNNVNISSMHKADRINIAVSAASILAKVVRDREIELLKKQYPNIGSGYPADKKTIAFLNYWLENNEKTPFFLRRSWKTLKTTLIKEQSLPTYFQ